ncbi:MAG TPA: TetR/AcrR family transcriptional regulator [Solirubrobacterales bacterium]|nr:TetR/AcrR family transcriptional regulator [Solirubrobacterales bacterium]
MSAADPTSPPTRPLFPRLTAGRGAPSAEQVARHQKARLQGAMVEAVARHGYAETTLRELVTLAGVSKSTFYQHFENKQDCFLSTFDEIAAILRARVAESYRSSSGDDVRERFVAGLSVFLAMAVEEPAAATLGAVESLTLGAAGVEHRERSSEAFEEMVAQGLASSPSPRQLPPSTIKAVVAGIRGITYRRLRSGRQAELPGMVEELVDWALRYLEPDDEITLRAMAAAEEPAPPPPPLAADELPWDEPPDSTSSRRLLSQRERMARGTARLVVEGGYEALTIPAISNAAGVSNQTFYEHFDSKRDAFLAAFELSTAEALTFSVAALELRESRPEALGAGMRALLEHISRNEIFARLAFFELPSAGPAALDRADAILDSFTAFLEPAPGVEDIGTAPVAVREAIASGTWAVIQHEIHHGRRGELPALAPELIRLALASLDRA